MFNLLRMDLYRMKRAKSVYVCLASMLFVITLCYVMMYLLATPEGQKTAMKIGMIVLPSEAEEGRAVLEGIGLLDMFREANMNGGMYNIIFGVAVALLVCADYQDGAVKNIMTLHRERWTYIGSKLIAAGILDFFYLVLGFGFNILMNVLFGNMVPLSGWGSVSFYLAWAWLVSMAFGALVIMICVVSRSMTAGVLGAVLGGSGMAVLMLSTVLGYFKLDGWKEYTLWYSMAFGPSAYSSLGDLKVVAVGAVFLVLYSALSVVSLVRQDI